MRPVLLMAGGALAALFLRRVAVASTAFPRELAKLAEDVAAEIRDMQEFFRELDGLQLTQSQRETAAAAYLRGRSGRRLTLAGPTR